LAFRERLPTATWYVLSASEATVTVTPVMQKNMKTSVHHAKLGKPPWIADIMELTKAMIQASCYTTLASRLPTTAAHFRI
jgi:hypothetical protein